MGSEIDSAPEDVLHTGIDALAPQDAQLLVQAFGILFPQIVDLPDAEICQISGDAGPDARDGLKV
jgi:hypothetical protein